MSSFQEFEKYNPLRSPCWRCERVLSLAAARPRPRRPSPESDDEDVRAYFEFLLAWRGSLARGAPLEQAGVAPGLAQAHELYHDPDAEKRAILEARLVTGESDAEIAAETGLPPALVRWYESLFFNVRDRLRCLPWMVKTIRGPGALPTVDHAGELTEHGRNVAYKLFAFFGGPVALDALLAAISPRPPGASISAWLDDTMRQRVRLVALMAVAGSEIHRPMAWMRLHLKFLKWEARGNPDASSAKLAKNIEAMLAEIRGISSCRASTAGIGSAGKAAPP
jgi:hypothetical protein